MTNSVPRAVVYAFYQAYISRDPEQIGAIAVISIPLVQTIRQVTGSPGGNTP